MIDTQGHVKVFNEALFKRSIHLIGCGGVGTSVATGLVRMGLGQPLCPIHTYDGDSYEPHNLANQSIDKSNVGEMKVEGLRSRLLAINPDAVIKPHPYYVDFDTSDELDFEGVVIMCLDTMEPRADQMEFFLENNRLVDCVIETRMDAEIGMSHCFDPNNKKHQERWWELWYPDEETEDVAGCGGPQSIISAVYGTAMIALKQLEWFARGNTALGIRNRVYYDFEYATAKYEIWPT